MLSKQSFFWFNTALLIIIAMNLRAPITAMGPMIDNIKEYYGINSSLAGFVNAIPLIAFGTISFIVGYFANIRAMFVALCLIVFGIMIRSYLEIYGLFVGMALLGSGIAVANVLLPSFVKEKFPNKNSTMMSVYSLMLNISSIAGIFLALPLIHFFGLINAMAFWAIFGILALVLYTPQIKNHRIYRPKKQNKSKKNLFASKTAWKITLFMGLQSFMAYSTFTWFASILISKGYSASYSAHILLFSQLVAAPISLFGPLLFSMLKERLKPLYMGVLCSFYVIRYVLLLIGDSVFIVYASAVFIGVPMGGVFGLALLFIASKSPNTSISTKLSSMSQGVGYLIAATGPFLIGLLNDYFHHFNEAIFLLLFAAIMLNICGILAYKSARL